MNSQSWTKIVTQNRKKCEKILAISKDIRYAGVFNEYGRTISGKIKSGVKPIFSPDSVRHEFFAIASMMRLREKTSKTLGGVEFISINHKRVCLGIDKRGKLILNDNNLYDDCLVDPNCLSGVLF